MIPFPHLLSEQCSSSSSAMAMVSSASGCGTSKVPYVSLLLLQSKSSPNPKDTCRRRRGPSKGKPKDFCFEWPRCFSCWLDCNSCPDSSMVLVYFALQSDGIVRDWRGSKGCCSTWHAHHAWLWSLLVLLLTACPCYSSTTYVVLTTANLTRAYFYSINDNKTTRIMWGSAYFNYSNISESSPSGWGISRILPFCLLASVDPA